MRPLITLFLIAFYLTVNGQTQDKEIGQKVKFSKDKFISQSASAVGNDGLVQNLKVEFPTNKGQVDIVFDETLISTKKLPGIQTYDGKSADGRTLIKLTFGTQKISGVMHTPEGYFFIEQEGDIDSDNFVLYNAAEVDKSGFHCGTVDESSHRLLEKGKGKMASPTLYPYGDVLKRYRMAAAATGEFTAHYGSQANALAAIVAIMNGSNLIYQLEASIQFQLISKTTDHTLIFTNAATDPFTPDLDFASAAASQAGFNTMHSNSTLNYSEYDIGHTFGIYTSSGISITGQAGPNPCADGSKARGWTEWNTSLTSVYYGLVVGVFVHEVGHQFWAPHTYNASGGTASSPTFCDGGWSSLGAYEPGSGSTLMGYHYNCTNPINYTLTGEAQLSYFNAASLDEILITTLTSYGNCFAPVSTGNTPPVADAGANIVIPKGTPFVLTGTASDIDADPLSYTWEQNDRATANDKGALGRFVTGVGGYAAAFSTTAPLFRSKQSATTTSRIFPDMEAILEYGNEAPDNFGETLPEVARNMKFRFTVRDNKPGSGGVDSDDVTVTVVNSGPFLLTSQNTPTLWLYNGTNTVDITWSVNGTNAAPLSVTNVKISLSIDGGFTFPHILAASTPNDGIHTIVIPNQITNNARIKIEPSTSSHFFDISDVNFVISTSCVPESITFTPTTPVTENEGSPELELDIAIIGPAITTLSGSIVSTDPISYLAINNVSSCASYGGNVTRFKKFEFIAPTDGNYSFGFNNTNLVYNIYDGPFNPTNPCENFVKSSGPPYTSPLSSFLEAGRYVLVVMTFSSTSPALPASFTVTVSGLPTYHVVPRAGSPYDYTYIIRNNASGNIVEFTQEPDLSAYSPGVYTVYALSYGGGQNLTSYQNTSFTSFQALVTAGTVCGKMSSCTKTVTVLGPPPPCPPSLSLTGPGTSGQLNAINTITSSQVISGASNNVTYRAGKSIELLPAAGSGFVVGGGAVFKAEIGGCP